MTIVLPEIPAPDEAAAEAARRRQDRLTKPRGSLGRLEDISIRMASLLGNPSPELGRKAVVVFAADHGVTEEGVSAYPSAVTAQMVTNFLRGGAAVSALARQANARVRVVDLGVSGGIRHPDLIARRIRDGTRNIARGPAMTRSEAERAIKAGSEVVASVYAEGLDVLAVGDMGIGNTTPASAVIAALTGSGVARVTGRGTGLDEAALRRKVAVIERALEVNAPDPADPLDVLSKVGGLEIAAMCGAFIAAPAHRVPAVIDGLISGAAALVASRLVPGIVPYLIASHLSVEPGHRVALDELCLEPLLDLGLRLGEGTGAVLALNVLEAAVRCLREMATFDEAGVSREAGRKGAS